MERHVISTQLEDIRSAALNLPEDDRVKLASDLLSSLLGSMNADIAAAWDIEICRRIQEVELGKAELYDADEVIKRVRSRIGV
jgi:hypothetical protein